jgi:nitroreductase
MEDAFLVGLTSIHWREAWKYGERAFRYCQHDTGHTIAALRLAASMLGWRLALLPHWSDDNIGAVLGVDREEDFAGAEREEPECIAVVTSGDPQDILGADPQHWVADARAAAWHGRANRLSSDHVEWPIIDEVAVATRFPGGTNPSGTNPPGFVLHETRNRASELLKARQIILQRRSAVAFNPAAPPLARDVFLSMLARLKPSAPPWDAIGWPAQVHLAVFVHRVEGLVPGVYAYLRDPSVLQEWKAAMRPEFLWERNVSNDPNDPNDPNALFLLLPIACSQLANRVSCDQDIAADGFFSLGMIARFAAPLRDQRQWIYRRLFWECGMIGQVLYLEAEAAGARATGIGCYYDDAVHELLGLHGDAWQSLYHFSMGEPVEDTRLTTEAGYPWE